MEDGERYNTTYLILLLLSSLLHSLEESLHKKEHLNKYTTDEA